MLVDNMQEKHRKHLWLQLHFTPNKTEIEKIILKGISIKWTHKNIH